MNRVQAITALAALSIFASFGSAAQAQTALTNGATISATTNGTVTRTAPVNTLDLSLYGTNATTEGSLNLVSRTPTITSINGTNVSLSFTGFSGVFNNISYLPKISPTASSNYLMAYKGTLSLDFSSAQNYFSMRWGSVDVGNQVAFYNGDTLVTSISGAGLRSLLGVSSAVTSKVEFNFAELGFTRMVATGPSSNALDFDQVAFSSATPDVAPIPLNAASLGGLMSFLMMLAMRGKGGTQVAIRLALASLMPRRRGTA